MTETALARIEQAVRLLAEARDIEDVTHIYAMAAAAEQYAKAERLGQEAEGYAREIRLRAARKAGEVLRAMAENGERLTSKPGLSTRLDLVVPDDLVIPTLSELGVSRDQSARWQRMAALPDEDFEGHVLAGHGENAISRSASVLRPTTRIQPEHGKRSGPTLKQSLRGLESAAIQLQSLAEALDGALLGDWSQLYSVDEAQQHFDVVATSLPVVTARLRRVLREREAQRGADGSGSVSHGAFGGASH